MMTDTLLRVASARAEGVPLRSKKLREKIGEPNKALLSALAGVRVTTSKK